MGCQCLDRDAFRKVNNEAEVIRPKSFRFYFIPGVLVFYCILKHFTNAPLYYLLFFSNMVELRIFSWSYFMFVYNEETICCNLALIMPFVLT